MGLIVASRNFQLEGQNVALSRVGRRVMGLTTLSKDNAIKVGPLTMAVTPRMSRCIASVALVLIIQQSVVSAVRNLRIASPLQAFTIWDAESKEEQTTPRSRFLPKFKAGLDGEAKARKKLVEKRDEKLKADATSSDWAKQAASANSRMRASDDKQVEEAFDQAVADFEKSNKPKKAKTRSKNEFQFVGVVNPPSEEEPIVWYARKKPADSKWSVRLVHANRGAIIKDLFNRGKVDVFAKYENTGKNDEETKTPIINSNYCVKDRSWK